MELDQGRHSIIVIKLNKNAAMGEFLLTGINHT